MAGAVEAVVKKLNSKLLEIEYLLIRFCLYSSQK